MKSLVDAFLAKTGAETEGGCLEWTGARNALGYGRCSWRVDGETKTILAHRAAWEIAHGVAPAGLVCHRCDNPPCVNPAHLFIGTNDDNTQDRARKFRFFGSAKLTPQTADLAIRRCRSGETQREVARSLGVSEATLSRVVNRSAWKYIDDPRKLVDKKNPRVEVTLTEMPDAQAAE